jgi:hypothetical protein
MHARAAIKWARHPNLRKRRGRASRSPDLGDRLFFIQLYRWFPSLLDAISIIRPETLVRWHRAGFRLLPRMHPTNASPTIGRNLVNICWSA